METIELEPVKDNPADYDDIEESLAEFFKREIYLPLIAELGLDPDKVFNSMDDLINAIARGRITFDRGRFTGTFTAPVSRELKRLGAKWKSGGWNIYQSKLPIDVQNTVRTSEARFQKAMQRIDQRLAKILPEEVSEKLELTDLFDSTLWKYQKSINKTLKGLTIQANLTPEMRRKIAKDYTDNLKIPIADFTRKETEELRAKIRKETFKGNRYEGLVKTIQDSYGVSARKAKFLARQETNLMLGAFKEARYADADVREYKWRCVTGTAAHPTRKRHKELNDMSLRGHIFRFDDPPVVTEPGEPQRRANPGLDYNCRCASIPVLRF